MMDIRSNEIVEVYTDSTVQMQNQNNMEASPMDMEIVTSNTELTYNGSPIVAQFYRECRKQVFHSGENVQKHKDLPVIMKELVNFTFVFEI